MGDGKGDGPPATAARAASCRATSTLRGKHFPPFPGAIWPSLTLGPGCLRALRQLTKVGRGLRERSRVPQLVRPAKTGINS
eukprot:scaffold82946_cov34-Phaeocystis_antarctica.AAC.2